MRCTLRLVLAGVGVALSACGQSDDGVPTAAAGKASGAAAGAEALPQSGSGGSAAPSGGSNTGGSSATQAGGSNAGSGENVAGAQPMAGAGGTSAAGGSAASGAGGAVDGGALAAKPLMGWSTWSSTTGNVSDALIRSSADLVASKLASFGYRYVNVDDGWSSGFDANGYPKPNTQRFPNGIKAVADYVHSKGLKFGIYLTPGINDTAYNANGTVVGTSYHLKDIALNQRGSTDGASGATSKKLDFSKPGAVAYVQGHADLLTSWGVDFIKMDFVGPSQSVASVDNQEDIKQWRAALDKTGHPVWLELSNMLAISAIQTWKTYSNGWRVANDVECYCTGKLTNWAHVVRVINALPPFAQHAGPGHWNDLDSLEIGVGDGDGITPDERQTMFSFWAINAAPLYIGAPLADLDAADLAILTNSEVIAVDQAGVPAKALSTASTSQVWYAKNADGSIHVGLFNLGSGTAQLSVKWSDVGAASTVKVRDLVTHQDLGAMPTSYSASLASHASRLLKLTP
jgi:alpha-galactosidase